MFSTTIRSKLREELPLSTRVHELAKELGLKSQELLERIQNWGLDVKVSALASLDPSTVARIRELMGQPSTGKDAQKARATPSSTTPSAPTVRSTPRPVASVPLSSAPAASPSAATHGSSSTARPPGPASADGPGPGCGGRFHYRATQTGCSRRPSCRGQAIRPHRDNHPCCRPDPLPRFPLQQRRQAPATDQGSAQETTPSASSARSIPLSSPPLSRSGGGFPHRVRGVDPSRRIRLTAEPGFAPAAEARPSLLRPSRAPPEHRAHHRRLRAVRKAARGLRVSNP